MSTDNQQIIRTAAVIGAGSMGSGIAAHLANAGVNVHLLDIPADEGDRDARAKAGVERQVKQRGFMDPEFAARVTPGNIEDHLDRLGEAEWIVEAVFEDLDVKHQTFAKIAAHRAPGTPVSSNTSTIPLAQLTEGMDADLLGDFAIIHAATRYTMADGQEGHGRYTDCWAKQNGKWLAVSAHVSR